MHFNVLLRERIFLIPLSMTFLNPKISGFLFPMKNSLTSENLREFMRWASKIVHEWNGPSRSIYISRPQQMENSRHHLLLRTDIYRKQSFGAPAISNFTNNKTELWKTVMLRSFQILLQICASVLQAFLFDMSFIRSFNVVIAVILMVHSICWQSPLFEFW